MNIGNTILWKSIVSAILIAVVYFMFLKVIKLIKDTVNHITNERYFSEYVANNFKKIGRLFLIIGVSASLVKFVIVLILQSVVRFKLDSMLFVFVILGLFFLFLSEAFMRGSSLEEENNLTI